MDRDRVAVLAHRIVHDSKDLANGAKHCLFPEEIREIAGDIMLEARELIALIEDSENE